MISNTFARRLYSEPTIDEAIGRLRQLQPDATEIGEMLHMIGIDKRTLIRTVQKGMEEYVDGLVELRHGWKPKMMDGSSGEKKEIYGGLCATMKRMEEFSEPYVSAMRLVSDIALKLAVRDAPQEHQPSLESAISYQGARYNFDEKNVCVTPVGNEQQRIETRKPVSIADAYSLIAAEFRHLKDQLNMMEDATTPDVYEGVRNTNEFPEARVGKCFETAHEIDRTMKHLIEGHDFLLKREGLTAEGRRKRSETVKLLQGLDRNRLTRATQFYAALQFHEKPWDRAYKASIASLVASVAGAAYSFNPVLERIQTTGIAETFAQYTNDAALFLAGAAWTIISGVAVYTFTDAGPKTAKLLRKVDERFIRYERI